MNSRTFHFTFGTGHSEVRLERALPALERLSDPGGILLVCDTHTEPLARRLAAGEPVILEPGEEAKGWASVERILQGACQAGLGRDGLFIGVGGGVVCDLTAFAASIYMRGVLLYLVPTTLLAMVDAALGGKTGFDLFGIKNLAGTFYPAARIHTALENLSTLPEREWRSGMAELVKTAVLDETGEMFSRIASIASQSPGPDRFPGSPFPVGEEDLAALVSRAIEIKGRVVEEDPRETGERRALLNLGHTFGHALEASAGLGRLSHGEAVAWGTVRACELGRALGITPEGRAAAITGLIRSLGYETRAPHPLMGDPLVFRRALEGDKKKRGGKPVFIIPTETGARRTPVDFPGGLLESVIYGA